MAQNLKWEEAVIKALEEAKGPLHYSEIADKIAELGLKKKLSSNPTSVVQSTLSNITSQKYAPVVRLGRGNYIFKTYLESPPEENSVVAEAEELEKDVGFLRAFGMYWQRDEIKWRNSPEIFGIKQKNADFVNFSQQKGVYILYDRHRPIYVGRAQKDRLGARLFEHTQDRLSSRWDRFSWFGLLSVTEKGELKDTHSDLDGDVLLATLEALLIEILETPLNRRRGDSLGDLEYFQYPDPAFAKERENQMITSLLSRFKSA